MERLYFKMDMDFKCPHCGYEMETTAYLNIEDSFCDKCEKEFYVEIYVSGLKVECIAK